MHTFINNSIPSPIKSPSATCIAYMALLSGWLVGLWNFKPLDHYVPCYWTGTPVQSCFLHVFTTLLFNFYKGSCFFIRGYEEVPWDAVLARKQWAPLSTLEGKADPVMHCLNDGRYDPSAKEWQVSW